MHQRARCGCEASVEQLWRACTFGKQLAVLREFFELHAAHYGLATSVIVKHHAKVDVVCTGGGEQHRK